MRVRAMLGILTLLPAALGGVSASAASMQAVPICTGDGAVSTILIPVSAPALPGKDTSACCVKGCHAAGSRKSRGSTAARTGSDL